jgi:5'-phosphate synthase pdxT subunit
VSTGASAPRIGVLALQGDVREHARMLEGLGARAEPVRRPTELAVLDGLVLPGGESTVIDKLSRAVGLQEPLREAIAGGSCSRSGWPTGSPVRRPSGAST